MDWKAEAERLHFDEKLSWAQTADRLEEYFPGLTAHERRERVRDSLKKRPRYKAEQLSEKPAEQPESRQSEIKSDGTQTSTIQGLTAEKFQKLQEAMDADPEYIIKLHGFDPKKWEIMSCVNNYWNSQLKGGTLQISYQSKLTVKPKKQGLSLEDIDKHFAALERQSFIPPIIKPITGNCMAEVNISDLHLGKLSWHGDTPENYDYKIAREIYYNIIGEVIDEIKNKPLEYITFVWANDFFNSDTIQNTTTGLTPQDCDIRWQKMFNVGVEMLVRGVEMLADIAPVKTFYTPSNHDEVNGYHALQYMAAWFRKDPNILIDTDAYPRKYQLYGANLLGYCHGEKEGSTSNKDKASRLASLMPLEAPELWGKSKYREMHTAHLHSEQMIQEINGVIVRRISAPTAGDTWHTKAAYIGAVRKAQTFIYDRERGLKTIINTPV